MVIILNKLSGKPLHPTPLVRMMVVAGAVLAVVLGMSVSAVLGGIAGRVTGFL